MPPFLFFFLSLQLLLSLSTIIYSRFDVAVFLVCLFVSAFISLERLISVDVEVHLLEKYYFFLVYINMRRGEKNAT